MATELRKTPLIRAFHGEPQMARGLQYAQEYPKNKTGLNVVS